MAQTQRAVNFPISGLRFGERLFAHGVSNRSGSSQPRVGIARHAMASAMKRQRWKAEGQHDAFPATFFKPAQAHRQT
jgi:hypothetical protein